MWFFFSRKSRLYKHEYTIFCSSTWRPHVLVILDFVSFIKSISCPVVSAPTRMAFIPLYGPARHNNNKNNNKPVCVCVCVCVRAFIQIGRHTFPASGNMACLVNTIIILCRNVHGIDIILISVTTLFRMPFAYTWNKDAAEQTKILKIIDFMWDLQEMFKSKNVKLIHFIIR